MKFAPESVYTSDPSETLLCLRELFSRAPLLQDAGLEKLAERLDVPVWVVEMALEVLNIERGAA